MTRRIWPGVAAAAAIVIVVAAAWFRIGGITAKPLWLDEAYSAYAASKGFAFLWQIVPRYETHPPFYYSLLRLWTLPFGDSLVALRAFGIACSLATLPVIALAGRELARWFPARFGRGIPLVLALLLLAALSRPLVEMAREVRPYPVMILAYAAGLLALVRLGRIAAQEMRIARGAFLLYLACVALMLWLHNLGALYGAAMGLAFLALVARPGLSRRDWVRFVAGHAAVALLWLPAILILADQAPTWVKSTWLTFRWDGMRSRLAFLYVTQDWGFFAGIGLLLLGAGALLRARPDGWRLLVALILLAGLPVAASLAVSAMVAPVFIIRTMTPVAVPALMLIAAGAAGWGSIVRWIGIAALLAFVGQLLLFDIDGLNRRAPQNWYGTVAWLAPLYRPGDQVWAYPNEGALPFDYAVRDAGMRIDTRSIPTPIPTLDGGPGAWNPTGSRGVFSLPPARLHAIARAPEARAIETIWLFRLGANAYDVGDVLFHALHDDGRVQVARWACGPIDIIGLRRIGPGVVASTRIDTCRGKPWPRTPAIVRAR